MWQRDVRFVRQGAVSVRLQGSSIAQHVWAGFISSIPLVLCVLRLVGTVLRQMPAKPVQMDSGSTLTPARPVPCIVRPVRIPLPVPNAMMDTFLTPPTAMPAPPIVKNAVAL